MPKTSDKILEILQRLETKIDNLEQIVKNLDNSYTDRKKNTPKKKTVKKKNYNKNW